MYGTLCFLLSIYVIIQLHKVHNIVSQFLCKTLPFLLADLLPDLCRELQLYRINVPAVPGAVDLSYPAASVVFILPGSRLSESTRVISFMLFSQTLERAPLCSQISQTWIPNFPLQTQTPLRVFLSC